MPETGQNKNSRIVAISGASGLLGQRLSKTLRAAGWQPRAMVRRKSQDGIFWNAKTGEIDAAALEGIAAVVHLAGENVFGRWTASKKRRILDSRVDGTRLIAETLAGLESPPKVLVSASAIGYYGDRGDQWMEEGAGRGAGFLADVCEQWEASTAAAEEAGLRVVHLRIGVVLDKEGGALAQMLTPFKLGVGGKLGSGQQYFSWIHAEDLVASILFALENEELRGPVNGVAPTPVTNAELTRTLGGVLRRPAFLPAPSFALDLVFGEMGQETLLASTRVAPRALQDAGFEFQYEQLESALRRELG